MNIYEEITKKTEPVVVENTLKISEKVKSDVRKTTFLRTAEDSKVKIRDRIKSLEQFSKADEKCVMGSGMCATHNCKLEKQIIERRTSCVDKNGKIGWTMREGTILACPKSTKLSTSKPAVNNQLGLGSIPTPTNKKQRLCEGKEEPIRLQNQYDITDE